MPDNPDVMKISNEAKFIDFDLDSTWNAQWLINRLRDAIAPLVALKSVESDVPFDPQDLEHQALFYLTTFSPGAITDAVIASAVEEQYLLIRERLLACSDKEELSYLFRGLKGFHPDLNVNHRLMLSREGEQLWAIGDGRRYEVEFRRIDDERTISLFTGGLHYIHHERTAGDAFAFFFKGDRFPWAIETTESGSLARSYKRQAIEHHGIDPDKTVELTRFYTLPGAPRNAISLMDRLVKRYYQERGVEALFTCTMPAYSKTKSTTIAGGINQVLCAKELRHYFVERQVEGKSCWQHVSRRWLEDHGAGLNIKCTDPGFKLLPVIDVFLPIVKTRKSARPEIAPTKIPYFPLSLPVALAQPVLV